MKYLCLVYGAEELMRKVDDHHCWDYVQTLQRSGHMIAGEALHPVHTATTVRVRDGKVSVTDGPFAETREQLAGFYLIEARDLDDAIQVAAGIPPASIGSIEVRPIRALEVD